VFLFAPQDDDDVDDEQQDDGRFENHHPEIHPVLRSRPATCRWFLASQSSASSSLPSPPGVRSRQNAV
jgi:hypothetical protein